MSIGIIIQVYIRKFRSLRIEELNYYREQSILRKAIELAALAINRKGKRHSHQRRLRRSTLEQSREILLTNISSIESTKDFDELIQLIEVLLDSATGLGELYIYDTSLRIGARLNLFPGKVYLHAGTRVGAKALGISRKAKAIESESLSVEFQELEPYEIEDVLCIFKDVLKKEKIKL